jgi:hypothetical protein
VVWITKAYILFDLGGSRWTEAARLETANVWLTDNGKCV